MSWLSPRTVRGWFVVIVLGALFLSQLASFALLASQQTILRSALHEAEAFRRTEGIVSLARNAAPETLRTIEDTASGPSFLVRFDNEPFVETKQRNKHLSAALAGNIGVRASAVRVSWDSGDVTAFRLAEFKRKFKKDRTIIITRPAPDLRHFAGPPSGQTFTIPIPSIAPIPPIPPIPPAAPEAPAPPPEAGDVVLPTWLFTAQAEETTASDKPERLDISIQMAPRMWLNVSALPPAAPSMMWPLILTGALAVLLVAIAAVWAAGRVARPIAGLTTAAERLGRGDALVLAPEEGPQDVKKAASAFNAMATRLRRMIEDQRALLSAVGHDLRTPIASLRIRTELVKDPELQAKMLNSIGEMERLTEATLAAARGGETGEPLRPVDLPSLVEAVCDDLADTGSPVSFSSLPAARVEGRASELRRALRNLIENGVRYGHRARVGLELADGFADLHVDDDGPGIPEHCLAHVMKPFVRLEESRSVETGGHGLGLTIARAIAERHGGEIRLQNRTEGGLRATLRLPAIKA
jgi:signal transduction histidine kinase